MNDRARWRTSPPGAGRAHRRDPGGSPGEINVAARVSTNVCEPTSIAINTPWSASEHRANMNTARLLRRPGDSGRPGGHVGRRTCRLPTCLPAPAGGRCQSGGSLLVALAQGMATRECAQSAALRLMMPTAAPVGRTDEADRAVATWIGSRGQCRVERDSHPAPPERSAGGVGSRSRACA